jgi:hypothetical protein
LRKGITTCVRRIESRLIGGRAVRASTLERATFNIGSKPNGSRTMRAYIAGKILPYRPGLKHHITEPETVGVKLE